jgi:hypothetical protein
MSVGTGHHYPEDTATDIAEDVAAIREDLNAILIFLTELKAALEQVAPMLAMLAPGLNLPTLAAAPR